MRVAPDSPTVSVYFDLGSTGITLTHLSYLRTREARAADSELTGTLAFADSAWVANKWFECGDNQYRVDFPAAAFVASAIANAEVQCLVKTSDGDYWTMPVQLDPALSAAQVAYVDSSLSGIKTSADAAARPGAAMVASNLSTVEGSAADAHTDAHELLTRIPDTGLTQLEQRAEPPSPASIATAVWDELLSVLRATGSIGAKIKDWVIGTAQSGDSYAIVNHATYGNSHLAKPGDSMAVSDKTGFSLLAGHGLALEATLTAIKGAGWTTETLAALKTVVDSILADTGTDGVVITQASADKVWGTTARSLTTFGTLVADVATAVWGAGTRTLTSFGSLVADAAVAVWATATKVVASVTGNVGGKVLGGGASAFVGDGAQVTAEVSVEGLATDEQVEALAATQAAILAKFATTVLAPVSPISSTGRITIYRGVDYNADRGNAIEFELPAETHGDLTSATAELRTEHHWLGGTIINGDTEDQIAQFELTHEESAALLAQPASYMLIVTLVDDDVVAPKARGALTVLDLPPSLEPAPG